MKQYQQLNIEEREKIQKGFWQHKSIRSIACELERSPSSISRELRRNFPQEYKVYTPRLAQQRAQTVIKQRGMRKRLKDPLIQKYVIAKLKEDYSPEQIAGTLPHAHPKLSISHEAIYQFIYAQYHRGGYGSCHGIDLRKYLKRHHKSRYRKFVPFAKETGISQGITRISARPEIVNTRTRLGDWEGDSMISRKSFVGLNTLVERKSGYLMISKLLKVGKKETIDAVTRRFAALPKEKRMTLTLDNGKENTGHRNIHEISGIDVYFANPYHSWERGTNENTNGLIRYYLPKGTDFATIHLNTLKAIERRLNNRPKKRLNYKTPHQIFNEGVALEC